MCRILHRYHDWYVLNVETNIKKKNLKLIFTDIDQKEYLGIQFLDVERSRIDNFTIGNIVSSIGVYSGEGSEALLKKDGSFKSLFSYEKEFFLFTKCLNKIKNSEQVYVELSTSYGCEIFLICSKIKESSG